MNLSIRQLETFREVMRSGSISQAARALNRTQPAISTAVNNLEDELGFALFMREHGKLTPTPEARYFLEEAEAILERMERTKQTLNRVRSMDSGKLRIACHPAASAVFMPRLLTEFLHDKPEVELTLVMRDSNTVADLIASQQFDVGLAETPPTARTAVTQHPFDLECVCVMRHDDPLASLPEVSPAHLDGRPMATLFPDHSVAADVQARFEQSGHRFHKRIELRTFLPGLPFIAAGFGYMVCDMITAYSHLLQNPNPHDMVVRRFTPRVSSSVAILLPGYTPQALVAKAFSEHLLRALQTMQSDMATHLG